MDEQITILIIDDDPDVREILSAAMHGLGYRLITAENGLRGLDKALEYLPDLIILDVMMPVLDGYETCRRIRANPMLADIPVLILTAYSDPSSRLMGIEAGADDFLAKPYDRIEILARVKTVTRLNRYRRILTERVRFAWVVDQAREGYVGVDEAGFISYANETARTLLSLPSGEKELKHIHFIDQARRQYTLMPPAAWEAWPNQSDPDLPMYMIRPRDEQGEAIWYQMHLLNLSWGSEKGVLMRIVEVTQDVTYSQEVWSLQSAVSHKFNTPLSTIMLASGLVRYFGDKLAVPELTDYARAIEQGAKRLEGEVNDIIQFMSVPSLVKGKSGLALVQLPEMVHATAHELDISEIYLDWEDPRLRMYTVRLPAQAMQILLWELLENAKKFHPKKSPRVEITFSSSVEGRVQMVVEDDGITLTPEQLAKAVIPYYQAEKIFTGEMVGMGLGLPTVASLLWSVGGDIRLYNRLDGPGLVAEIDLPMMTV